MPHINSYTSSTVDNNRVDLDFKYCNATRFLIAVNCRASTLPLDVRRNCLQRNKVF